MVVLGASERAGLGRIVPGSTAVRLLSSSAVPVAIAPRGYIPDSKREPLIGVGFDGGPEAEHALDWAATLALGVRGRLRMLAVHEPIAFGNVSTGAFPVQSVGQALRGQLKDEAEKAAAGLSRGPSPEILFKDGDPAGELIEASAELDLLVLGSRAHGPARSVLLGSVSEATVAGSEAPVVVVPRGHEKRTND
jgi:nucleotide-binding universal stress UspA family protein